MASKLFQQEAVMGQVIPKQHPAVVLRTHYKAVRALLAAVLVAVVALAATVVILANDNDTTVSIAPKSAQALPPGTRFDGGPDEGTRGIQADTLPPGTRFDGGPDEGTRGPQTDAQSASPLSSYQAPDEDSSEHAGGPRMIPMGPGGR
jgi:hypothetical protein